MNKAILSPVMLLLLAGCSSTGLEMKEGDEERASVVLLTADSQENYFTDFFPTRSGWDELIPGEGVTVEGVTDTTFTLSTSKPLSTLTLVRDEERYTLVVEDGSHFTEGYDRLFTTGYDAANRQVEIAYTRRPAQVLALWQNQLLSDTAIHITDQGIRVSLPTLSRQMPHRTYLRVYAATTEAPMSDILLPLEKGEPVTGIEQLDRHDPETQILYSVMIDRFCNGNTANDWSYGDTSVVLPQADYQGGDIAGITRQIEAGFFDSLGIRTLWISPITQNPYTAWGLNEQPRTRFSGYHGYWPIYIKSLERRFATEEELHQMLATAHSHDMNVILDYVANHLHQEAPLFKAHPEWATDSITPDGRRNFELWDEFRFTTWFDAHIPSLHLERQEIAELLTDSALWWMQKFDFDGFRHDACKHIPYNYWRTLTHKMKSDPELRRRHLWMIGETYGDAPTIGSYVKTGMLNAQFDFNLYQCATEALCHHNGQSLRQVAATIDQSGATYGSHHTMGNISGNHDKSRFLSLAGGDLKWEQNGKFEGWNRHVGVGDSVLAYSRQFLLNALNLTLPGVPCIYQGDEYGEEGGNDPDNRRFMRFDGYNHFEAANLARVKHLTQMRRESLPLQWGDYLPLVTEDETLVFLRIYLGKYVLVGINSGDKPYAGQITLPAALGGEKLAIEIPARDMILY